MRLQPTAAFTLLLLFLIVFGALFVASLSANFFPEQAPPGIQITSGGAVVGTSLIQRSGDVYTLTGDIYVTIVVLRDGIVLDGGGYTLQGSGSGTGVFLQERNNVVIQNMKIVNFSYGIKFTWLNYGSPTTRRSNKVSGNTIANNTYGITFYDFSEGNEVSNNYVANNTYGVVVSYSPNNVFRNNQFRNNQGSILDNSQSANDIDTSNTVNDKPVYYWVNQHDRTVPSDAGWVALKNCSGVTVQGLNLEGNEHGVLLYNTNGSTVNGNAVANNVNGITLERSSNNVISGNHVTNNKGYGIYLDHSTNNMICKNEIRANAKDGVNFETLISNIVTSLTPMMNGSLPKIRNTVTICNTVAENHVAENGGNGIFFRSLQDSYVIGNNVTLNKGCGIGFGYGPNGTIRGNYIAGNGVGIWISNAFENTITWNTIIENAGWGIRFEGSQGNNTIHHNNFINNSLTEALQASILGIWTYPGLEKPQPMLPNGTPATPEPPKLVPGAANAWDDGKEGNYWSDYTARYPNASAMGTSGVGNTPYFINENNIDYYPLMKPVAIHELPQPTNPPTNTAAPEQQPASLGTTLPIEYSYAAIAVVAIASVTAYLFLKRKLPVKSKDVNNQ